MEAAEAGTTKYILPRKTKKGVSIETAGQKSRAAVKSKLSSHPGTILPNKPKNTVASFANAHFSFFQTAKQRTSLPRAISPTPL